MKNEIAVKINGLSKVYNVYRNPSDFLKELIFRRARHEEFWALKKINLTVKKGEVIGIIGRNGSGKSTLLKILAGTLDKTAGSIEIHGRISAILELGLGFNPEYTGRQNIYNGAMVLGMKRKQIEAKIEKIIEFSELGEFIDRPFKTYSSGMQVRLTFSVASEIEPDILVIDEALAAGDMFFMAKCIDRMVEMCRSGATVFIVSHSTPMIRRLCTRAILLSHGRIEKDGLAEEVCSYYEMGLMSEESQKIKVRNKKESQKRIIGSGQIKILNLKILNHNQEKYSLFQNDNFTVRIFYSAPKRVKNPGVYILISRDDGVMATSYFTGEPANLNLGYFEGQGYVDFCWKKILLGDGNYLISAGFYPEMKGPDSIQKQILNPYILHDKCWSFKIQRKNWPRQTLYDQPVKVTHRKQNENLHS